MRADQLEVEARIRRYVRKVHADLRFYGVSEAEIRRCRTLYQLDNLHRHTLERLISAGPAPKDAA